MQSPEPNRGSSPGAGGAAGRFSRALPPGAVVLVANPRRLLIWTILAGTLFRLIAAAAFGLGYDESFYVASARHLALSYFDHPPLSIWITWATMSLTGTESAFVLRLPFIAMFAVTTWLVYRLGKELFGETAGALGALLLNLSPMFTGMVGFWMRPDGPLMLFLAATLLMTVRLTQRDDRQLGRWALAGLFLGLALLSKYHAVLPLVGVVLFAATSSRYRRWFGEPGPYLAIAVALIVFSPVLMWNAQNDWVSFAFHLARAGESGIHPEWLLRMLLGQIAYVGFWIWFPMVVAFWHALRAGPGESGAWLLGWAAVPPVLLFTILALWADVGWLFHWQAPGYLLLFPLLGAAAARWSERRPGSVRGWLWGSAAAMLALVAALYVQTATGRLTGGSTAGDPTLEALDWDGLAEFLDERGLLDRDDVFVVATHWTYTGKVDVQIGGDLPVVCLCDDPRNVAFGWDHTAFVGWDAVIVAPGGFHAEDEADYAPYFTAFEPLGTVDLLRGGNVVLSLQIVLAEGYGGSYPMPLPE